MSRRAPGINTDRCSKAEVDGGGAAGTPSHRRRISVREH
jgi:hypothetical protein